MILSSFCQNDLRKPKAAAARGIQALICTNPYPKSNWQKKQSFIKQGRKTHTVLSSHFASKMLNYGHQGEKDVQRQILSLLYQRNSEGMKATLSTKDKVHTTGLHYCNNNYIFLPCVACTPFRLLEQRSKQLTLVQNNIPLSFSDQLSPLLRKNFHDSEVAKGYVARPACTKTTCIVNGSPAPQIQLSVISTLHTELFSIAVDGSNDTGLVKMNPLTVCLYDVSEGSIVTRFLDMGLTKGHIVHHVNWGTNLSSFSAFL